MPHDLQRLVPAHLAIVAAIRQMFPDASDDDLADSIAGESNLQDAIVAVLRAALERDAYGKALAEMIEKMTARKRRLEEGSRSMRLAAMEAMQEAGLSKIRVPDMSVSIGRGRAKVVIVDEAQLPEEFVRVIREPNRAAIGVALASGDAVAGVEMSNAQPILTIHRS